MPQRKVKVRRHKRRKPRQEERIKVDEYEKTIDLVVPRGHEREFLGARNKFESQSARSQAQDLELEAEQIGFIDDKEHLEDWKRAPNEHDIIGIDDPTYGPVLEDLPTLRKLLGDRLGGLRRTTGEIVKKAKVEAKRVAKSKAPAKEKKRKLAKIRHTAKRDIKKVATKERKVLEQVKEKVHRVTRAAKKWSAERRRRANYVSQTTGSSVIEADALIRRAHLKGVDYDTVDWDAMQGKDLAFDEKLGRLEQQVGKTYVEGEYEQEIRAQEQAWNDLQAEREDEVERATRQPYKQEDYEIPPEIY